MTFKEHVLAARTCRYYRDSAVSAETLRGLVDCARIAPSARNQQPLRYALVVSAEARRAFFPVVSMMGGRSAEERADEKRQPAAYIVITAPKGLGSFGIMDIGIAAQTINLAAREAGLSCCMIGAFKKSEADKFLNLPDSMESMLVLAVGVPDEDCRLTGPKADGTLAYYNDEEGVHWVPKRALDDVILMTK